MPVAFTNILCEKSSKVNEEGVHLKQNGDSVNLKQNGESVHWEANKANDFLSIVKTLLLKHSDRNCPKVIFEMKCSQRFDKQDFWSVEKKRLRNGLSKHFKSELFRNMLSEKVGQEAHIEMQLASHMHAFLNHLSPESV